MLFRATQTKLERLDSDLLVSGSYNMTFMAFEFDASWDGMIKTVVIKNGPSTFHVMLENDRSGIPQAALLRPGTINIGVFGILGTKIQPTIWVTNIPLWSGAYDPLLLPNYPDPGLYEQIMAALSDTMATSVYDPRGLMADVFAYADSKTGSKEVEAHDTSFEFPNQGQEDVLYIERLKNKAWQWDPISMTYQCVGSDYSEITIINGGNA